MSDDQRFDNPDWHPGMPLPSRKETHNKKKSKAKQSDVAANPPSASRVTAPPEELTSDSAEVIRREIAQGASEAAAAAATASYGDVTAEERAMLLDDDGTILTIWQRLLLFVAVPLVMLAVLVWGKIGYVHQVPDMVRENVPAYASGEGFLVLKPWWFGPPVYELDSYPQADTFSMYQIRMGDHAPLTDDPFVLWRFQQDILQ